DKEGFKPTAEERKQEIKDLAAEYNMDEKTVRDTLTDKMLNHDIAVRKAMDLVTDNAKQVAKKDLKADKDSKKSPAKKSSKKSDK
ncbi:MAG: trigger factor, partial [Lactobacillus sp.]